MKPFCICFFFTLLYTCAIAQSNDIAIIKKLNQDWLNAYPARDTATLGKILADDFVMVNPAGVKQTKRDNLQNVLDPTIETTAISFDSVQVILVTPDVAILTAWANFTFKANGNLMTGKNCYQDIYTRRKDKWVAIAAHVTSLGMK